MKNGLWNQSESESIESDGRMLDASAGSSTHFVDRDPERFSKVLNYLRDGTLLVDKNCNLEKLRLEADFYGLDDLVRTIDETKARNELRNTTMCVTVFCADETVTIAVNPREDDHFLMRHLQQHYPCRVGLPSFRFPYGFTFELSACNACSTCTKYKSGYASHCKNAFNQRHGCVCTPGTADVMLKDIVSTLESRGYVMDRNVDATFYIKGSGQVHFRSTSQRFVKRQCLC